MIKFLDLKAINDSFEPDIRQSVERVLNSGWYLLGNEVKAFEEEYSNFIGTKYCIGVANGLDALRLILKAYIVLGIMKEGDEIIVPANTYIASILAITDNRLVPILVEPDINTYNINPYLINEKITKKTKGIMLVHLYGLNAMHPEISRIIKENDLKLIEDNAQAAGCYYIENLSNQNSAKREISSNPPQSTIQFKRTGSLGNASGHSFYPGKNMGCLGDGGAVTTDDDELATVVRALANYGSLEKYRNVYQGLNSRLDEIQAAILRIKLKRLDEDNKHRQEIAQYYLNNIKHPQIMLPKYYSNLKLPNKNLEHIWHLFVVRNNQRDKLQSYLLDNGIQTIIHYPIPPHQQQAYKEWNHLSFPITEQIHKEVLSLPISPIISKNEAQRVVEKINLFS